MNRERVSRLVLGRFGPRVKRPRPLTAAEAAGILWGMPGKFDMSAAMQVAMVHGWARRDYAAMVERMR